MSIAVYDFYDPQADRTRLAMQSRLFSHYLRANARAFAGPDVGTILDLGCGEGQMGMALCEVYPQAHLVGLDRDPAAIAQAQQILTLGVRRVTFVVGDMTQGLPPGPFDLIYASLSLSHLRQPAALVPLLYQALGPGGVLWIKDLGSGMEQAARHPLYEQLIKLCFSALAALGGHMQVIAELRPLLIDAGFTDPHLEIETYPLGGSSAGGRSILANMLRLFYTTRQAISRVHGMPESEIEAMCASISRDALHSDQEIGTAPFSNLLVRRPVPRKRLSPVNREAVPNES
jgi:SAM-dependent methyltransferase